MRGRGDIAVVGAGIVGLATALALRDRGHAVTVYERGAPGMGQSAGTTRIFRTNHDDPALVRLALRSLERWRELEGRFGVELVGRGGVLLAGPAAATRLDAMRAAGASGRLVEAAEQRAALPFLPPFAEPVVLDEAGGPIRVRAAIEALAGGADIVRAEVLALRERGAGGVDLVTPEGIREHAAAVVCAGEGTRRLGATLALDLPVVRSLHLRATFRVRGAAPQRAACLMDGTGVHGEQVYGSPLPGTAAYAIGISGEDGDLPAPDDGALAGAGTELAALGDRAGAYVERALPGLYPERVAEIACWVTELPPRGDAFAAWRAGATVLLAGTNLFKHAPALGDLLADAATGAPLAPVLEPA